MPIPSRLPVFRMAPLLLMPALIVGLTGCGSGSAQPAPSATPPGPSPQGQPTHRVVAAAVPGSYAALGASETYGDGASPHTNGYAYLVRRALGAKHFVDVGIPGTTLDAGYQSELTSALAIRPSLCTAFFGVNDLRAGITRESFLSDLRDLAATLRRAHCQVLIIGIPDLTHVPAVAQLHIAGLKEIVASWNAGMAQIARQTGSHFLDLRQYDSELAQHPEYVAPDGLHPSNAGHARLAQVVTHTVRSLGLWKAH